jgi:hypothetical protein
MFTPLDNPARISPGSAWYFNVLCLLRWIILPGSAWYFNALCLLCWIILPGSPQDQLGILMYYVYSTGISLDSLRPAGISPGSFILGFMYYVYSAG